MAKKPKRIDRRIDVILLESNKHLGEKYELIKVKPIFAKNVLFPNGLAVYADADALYAYKAKMAKAQEAKVEKADIYKAVLNTLTKDDGLTFSMTINEKGVLYEKIDPTHIVALINTQYKVDMPSHLLKMKKKITQVGEYMVSFQYASLEKDIRIVVK